MQHDPIHIHRLPDLKYPICIAGFEGWGNALDVSKAMITYLIRKLDAEPFASINGDLFYRFDESRPWVEIEGGVLKSIDPPGGNFYTANLAHSEHGLLLLRATEPHVRWYTFVEGVLRLCKELQVETIITLGSMYDNVLHSDTVISGFASTPELLHTLEERDIVPVNYQGPGAIHSLFHSEGQKLGFQCISLWCHCPYYLQGTTHFGLLSALGETLSFLCGFELDRTELDVSWKELNKQIQSLIEKNPELQKMIEDLRKAKVRGSWETIKGSPRKDGKVIHIEDFLRPKS